MKKLYLIIAIFLIIGTGITSYILLKNNLRNTLNCEETLKAALTLSDESIDIFNGIEDKKQVVATLKSCNAKEYKSISECNSTNDNLCGITIGVNSNDIKECASNKTCEMAYATAHNSDCNIYKNNTNNYLKNVCLFSKAYVTQEKKYCNEIEEISAMDPKCQDSFEYNCLFNRNKCLWGISDNQNDVSVCDSMTSSPEKDICYFSIAVKNSNPEICKKITTLPIYAKFCPKIIDKSFNQELLKQGVLNISPDLIEKNL